VWRIYLVEVHVGSGIPELSVVLIKQVTSTVLT